MSDDVTDKIMDAMDRIPRSPTPYAQSCAKLPPLPAPDMGSIELRDGQNWSCGHSDEAMRAYAAAAVAAERERCADICDQHSSCEGIAERCAAAIRADEPSIDGWPLWSGLPPPAKGAT